MKNVLRFARDAAIAAGAVVAISTSVGCGGSESATAASWKAPDHAVWQDAFTTTPDFLIAIHPQTLASDSVYGPMVKTSLRAAATRSTHVVSDRLLDALQSCDEVIVGKYGDADTVDGILVLSGVRADLDPAKITDDSGGPLWVRASTNGAVPEYRNGADASLFDIGHRTWVIAAGKRRNEAREAFAHPFGRPAPFSEDDSLAVLRIRGDVLLNIAPRMRYSDLAPLGKHLTVAQLSLRPGSEGAIEASFSYSEDDAAAFAEQTLRDVTHALEASHDSRPAWLRGTSVSRQERVVSAKATITSELMDRLKKIGMGTPNGGGIPAATAPHP